MDTPRLTRTRSSGKKPLAPKTPKGEARLMNIAAGIGEAMERKDARKKLDDLGGVKILRERSPEVKSRDPKPPKSGVGLSEGSTRSSNHGWAEDCKSEDSQENRDPLAARMEQLTAAVSTGKAKFDELIPVFVKGLKRGGAMTLNTFIHLNTLLGLGHGDKVNDVLIKAVISVIRYSDLDAAEAALIACRKLILISSSAKPKSALQTALPPTLLLVRDFNGNERERRVLPAIIDLMKILVKNSEEMHRYMLLQSLISSAKTEESANLAAEIVGCLTTDPADGASALAAALEILDHHSNSIRNRAAKYTAMLCIGQIARYHAELKESCVKVLKAKVNQLDGRNIGQAFKLKKAAFKAIDHVLESGERAEPFARSLLSGLEDDDDIQMVCFTIISKIAEPPAILRDVEVLGDRREKRAQGTLASAECISLMRHNEKYVRLKAKFWSKSTLDKPEVAKPTGRLTGGSSFNKRGA